MDPDTTLHVDNDQPPAEDTIMTTETTTETIVVKEETTEQDPLDLALDQVKNEENYDSSDLDLSSDDEDDSSSDGSAANNDDDDDDDDEDTKLSTTAPLVSTNEVTDIQIERPNFELTDSTPVAPVGTIFSVIDKTVVVQTQTHGNVLDMESLLVLTDDRVVLGEVFETFGPVDRPFYSVRFNSMDEIPSAAKSGARVAYVPSYARTQLVQVEKLKLLKGTDASNRFDEEAGDDELEFSDDEQEMAYNRSKKKSKQQRQKKKVPTTTDGGHRQLQSYADIMGFGGPAAPSTAQRANNNDTMDDLLNSYMASRPGPHNPTPSSTRTATTTTVKLEHGAAPSTVEQASVQQALARQAVAQRTPATTTVKDEHGVAPVSAQQALAQEAVAQWTPATTTVKLEHGVVPASAQQAVAQPTSAQTAPVQQAPPQQLTPLQQVPVQQAPEQQAPEQQASVKSEVSSSTPASTSSEQKPQSPPPTSFFQSIRSLFSRGPPPSSS
ncbi:hypothetical protein [Absidia glauca]|uniref:H/ACA ribonucleoprotein complex non-core subunit NAF1 n=1 Tax=Absidia glauca TaxID=4829 RepID=A0A163LTT2_ABSGL|nr:hypothetical protein [Absidia glauca]